MTKKILIIILILLLIVISIFSYNFYKNVKQPINTNALVAVPQNASFIIQGRNFKDLVRKLTSSNIIWEELVLNTSSVKEYNTQINYLDSLTNDQTINQLILNQPVLASIHQLGATGFDAIYYFSASSSIDEEQFINHLKSITKLNPEVRVYDEVSIYNFKINEETKLALIYHKGIFAISFSTILIEDVIRQLNAETSLLNDISFGKILNTSGESDFGNVFINPANFNKILNPFTNQPAKKALKNVELFSGWMALDASIKSNALMLNGFSIAEDSSDYYLSLFSDQKPQEMDLVNILPSNTSYIYYNSFSDVKNFRKKRKTLLTIQNQATNYENLVNDFSKNNQLDIEEEWLSFLGNEMAAIITEPYADLDYTDNQFIVFKVLNTEKTIFAMNNIASKINEENHPTTVYNDYSISKIDLTNFFPVFFGKPFLNLNNPHYTIIDDYLVFGNSESALQQFISNNTNQKTLQHDVNYQAFKENLSSNSTIFIYNNIARSAKLYPNFLDEKHHEIIEEKTELLRKFEAVAIQINSQKNNLYYNNIYLKYNPVYKQDTRTVWETELEAPVNSKPEIVLNHLDNTKEIFVQDNNNKIYLISNTGKILWSKQLSSKIIGKTYQVDALKNNKLQLLFNTTEKLYLLDRNGKDVGKFPVQLSAPASSGVIPMDYEKNRNYRLLVGCQNNMIYNYDIEGNLVKGWEYQSGEAPAHNSISHFQLAGKDYIVIPLKNGKLKIIERSGKDRLILKNKLPISNNPVYLKVNTDLKKVFVSTLDSLGNVVKLYFNDIVETTPFNDVESMSYFDYFDVNNDNTNEYIFAANKTLRVIDSEKNELFKLDLNNDISGLPLFFKMPDKTNRIGIVATNNIYLINHLGEIEHGFPLNGSTPFSITHLSNDKTLNLVVGDKNSIYMYNLE
ncbi:MAG: DUF3352 domain-containing protein [Flavobacteriales bacterium]